MTCTSNLRKMTISLMSHLQNHLLCQSSTLLRRVRALWSIGMRGKIPLIRRLKKKNKKTKKTETKIVKCDSFFNFFKTTDIPEGAAIANLDEAEEKELGDKV